MKVSGIVKKGEYFDSVSIMLIAKRLSGFKDIIDSAVLMGTKENLSVLKSSGLLIPEFKAVGEMDLLIVFKTEDNADIPGLLKSIDILLKPDKGQSEDNHLNPSSLESAVSILPGANLAMISIAGRYAGDVAMKSLQNSLNVMLFSDNVPIDKEIELKTFAADKGLFVMGPDCGTAIINGIPLAFANVVNRGNIGIVGASGTGLQEVSCIISNSGCGVSQAIGTGGRDVKKEVGGIMFLQGLQALADDRNTDVILLVSKPPAKEVIEKIKDVVKKINKPVVSVFLGSSPELLYGSKIHAASTLEEAALLAVALSQNQPVTNVKGITAVQDVEIKEAARIESAKLNPEHKYLRALFSGGTFCDETQLLCNEVLTEVYSNTPVGNAKKLKDSAKSEKHTIIDLGDDEFTVGKPHPMIDYSTRCKRIIEEAEDPETAVILLDIVLGYGSNMNPLAEIIPVIRKVKEITSAHGHHLPIVCSVTGTDKDPQNRTSVVTALQSEGVIVMKSNAAASRLAILISYSKGVK
ncbi:MAG: acyl-CoA synthetase FdrA [Ignavibacteriaceae bacterium]|nr:acyl-CoA synthetase FdrA [Ignavibacteriaceae bacterium]